MSFSSLPNEIIINISQYQDIPDLRSLKLTCRRLSMLLTPIEPVFKTRSVKFGQRLLFSAAGRGDSATVRSLMDRKILNFIKYRPLLEEAVKSQEPQVVRTLLACSASNPAFNTRLFQQATSHARIDMVKLLIERDDVDVNSITEDFCTALHIAIDARLAVAKRDLLVRALLNSPRINPNIPDADRQTPLYIALKTDDTALASILLADPRTDVNVRDRYDHTPLYRAATSNTALMSLLLAHPKIDVNLPIGSVPLIISLYFCDPSRLRLLLQHPNIKVNAQDSHEMTVLHYAAISSTPTTVQTLLEHPDINVNARDRIDQTALHRVAGAAMSQLLMQSLLAAPGIDVNAQNTDGLTPLHVAIDNQQRVSASLLLGCPAVDVNLGDFNDETPLHLAVRLGNPGLVEMLLRHKDIKVKVRNRDYMTPLELAKSLGNMQIPNIIKMLEERGG